jgi:hypothetical protein
MNYNTFLGWYASCINKEVSPILCASVVFTSTRLPLKYVNHSGGLHMLQLDDGGFLLFSVRHGFAK